MSCREALPIDTVSQDKSGNYIFFDVSVANTKGTLHEGTSLQSVGTAFGVFGYRPEVETYGYPIFSEYEDNVAKVYWDTDCFTYDHLALWHNDYHSFYAYYPYDTEKNVITEIYVPERGTRLSTRPYIIYSQPINLNDMVDIMTDLQTLNTGGVVDLSFQHRLFAFGVKVNNNQTDSEREIVITAANISIADVAAQSTLYFDDSDNNGELDYTPGTNTTSITHAYQFDSDGTEVNCKVSHNLNDGNYFLLTPCSSLKLSGSITIKNAWDETITFPIDYSTSETAYAPTDGFKAGYMYFLNINKTDKGIEFTIENAGLPWEENDDIGIGFN